MLTAANLDRRQAERDNAHLSLPELLLRSGAMTGPHRITRPVTVSGLLRMKRAVRSWILNRKGISL